MLKEKFLKGIPVSGTRPTTEVSAVGRKTKLFPLKGHYCRTVGPGQLTGSERPRQLDFLIKSIDLPLNAVTDWTENGVIGEFSAKPVEDARKEKFGQLTRYAREIFFRSRFVDFSMDSACMKQTLNCGCLTAQAHIAQAS
ncbi:Bgt-50717 [Blumeria graminis f. sp. tritici]|uniref:Bgt-50717 n=1 Tax=Blumeria graminis f. sp. tritici TaxID=62690 RepID=A0A9X9L9F6_BLUGR|nr:Bgt-50717 [Blumeria graminis f. sp. tritici]